jgi:hypothetical protein
MTQVTNISSNSNDQPVNFGPVLWDVLDQVGSAIGGATYLIGTFFSDPLIWSRFYFSFTGLSLHDPTSPNMPLVAGLQSTVVEVLGFLM